MACVSREIRRRSNARARTRWRTESARDGAGVPCAMLDPKLVGEAALPLAEVEKIPGCRPNKEQDIAEAEKLVS